MPAFHEGCTERDLDLWIENDLKVLFEGYQGVGKCLGKGTPVLMFDGSIKPVEKIKPGEKLMGPDSKPRRVLSVCNGKETLYRVVPTKGDSYIVNESHILSLKMSAGCGGYFVDGEIVNISVKDWLTKSAAWKQHALGYRVGVDFPKHEVPLDPYFVGLWLGDGTTAAAAVTTADQEIVEYMESMAKTRNMELVANSVSGKSTTYNFSTGRGGKGLPRDGRNSVLNDLRKIDVLDNKHIPEIYKINSRENRLRLLAGLLDSDGSVSNNCFDYITRLKTLANDVVFVARSLGFAAYVKPSKKCCTYKGEKRCGNYWRVTISGNTQEIPTALSHKKCNLRSQKKDVLRTGIRLEKLRKGEYFGFEIDGDRLFLLGDFTVTHNTAMVKAAFERNFGHMEKDSKGQQVYVPGVLGRDYIYFSAPTLDPWVDLVGVPYALKKEIEGQGVDYLGLLRPEYMVENEPQGIFIDELNRAPKKVRNAVMELIQFGSINGHKFKNLRCVWAAINPEDDQNLPFDVEPLDPALRDRFHVHVGLPFAPDEAWFAKEFGKETAKAACTWWNKLDQPVKMRISPRRLEYAVRYAQRGLSLRHFLPKECNPTQLATVLRVGLPEEKFRELLKKRDIAEMRKFLAKPNLFDAIQRFVVAEQDAQSFCLPLLDSERLTTLLSKHHAVKEQILCHPLEYKELIRELARGAQNIKLKDECTRLLPVIKQMEEQQAQTGETRAVVDVKGLPEMVTQKQTESLRTNYILLSEKECSKLPALASYKNDKGEPIVDPFTDDIEEELDAIALMCRIGCTNNYYRNQMIERVSRVVVRPDLSPQQVMNCMNFADYYAAHSHDKTVCTNSLFALVVNDLVRQHRTSKGSLTTEELFDILPNVFYRYFGNPKTNREETPVKDILRNLVIQLKPGAVQPSETVKDIEI